jgi:hypothetical protein
MHVSTARREHSNNGRYVFYAVRVEELEPISEISLTLQSELLGFSRCELLLLDAVSRGQGQFGNPDEGARPPLEATTKQQQ